VRSVELGQNFLRNRRTARRLVHLAGDDLDLTCVDLGAGRGSITESALDIRSGPVVAIEIDPRLATGLRARFDDDRRVSVVEGDLLSADVPTVPFVVAANPPFGASTALVRRWFLAANFQSGAVIVETRFAGRVTGGYGATKLSLSLAAFLDLEIAGVVKAAEFSPPPKVPTAILRVSRRHDPEVPWSERLSYWSLVNYLFERSRPTVGESIAPLRLASVARRIVDLPIRNLTVADVAQLHSSASDPRSNANRTIQRFNRELSARRRSDLLTD
jgi:23S rRNA (adenine-N6)-dimethyltransferase